jgi:hypothetical protein
MHIALCGSVIATYPVAAPSRLHLGGSCRCRRLCAYVRRHTTKTGKKARAHLRPFLQIAVLWWPATYAVPVAAPFAAQQAVASGCTSGGVRHQQISDLSLRQWRYMYIHIESDWRREFWTRIEHPKLYEAFDFVLSWKGMDVRRRQDVHLHDLY